MEVLTSLFTILIIVMIGAFSRKLGVFKAEHAKTLSSFVYYFGLPALFFVKITSLDLYSLELSMVLGTIMPTILLLGILLVLKWIKVLSKDTYVLSSLTISFGSYAFFGIAFFETFQNGKWLELSILSASLLGVMGIISTLTLLEYASKKDRSRGFLAKIFTNPLIISILLGTVFSLAGIQLGALNFALNLVGQTAGALAIFILGMFIFDRFSIELIKPSLLYSLFRIIGLPLITWITLRTLLPGSPELSQFLMLENSMPAAIALVVFAERYDYKVTETAGIVSLTSIFSFVGITVIYYISQIIF